MANSGSEEDKTEAVAKVASRLFGQTINPDAVIVENLARATNTARKPATLGASLAACIDAPLVIGDNDLYDHPLAVWIELEIGNAACRPRLLKPRSGLQRRRDGMKTAAGHSFRPC
jgi:hypothetical protein